MKLRHMVNRFNACHTIRIIRLGIYKRARRRKSVAWPSYGMQDLKAGLYIGSSAYSVSLWVFSCWRVRFTCCKFMIAYWTADLRQRWLHWPCLSHFYADAFVDETTRATYYRAEIILNDGQIDRLPAHITLIPGMPVEAFIRTSDRSPLSYLVKPLTDYFAKAFREG